MSTHRARYGIFLKNTIKTIINDRLLSGMTVDQVGDCKKSSTAVTAGTG
jgi:hypothetical protein